MPAKWEKHRVRRSPDGLSPRYRKLVDAYFGEANFNKSKAIRLAGYKSEGKKYTRVFDNPAIVKEVERRHRDIRERYKVDYNRISAEMARVAFSNIYDYAKVDENKDLVFDFSQLDAVTAAAIGEVTVETYVEGRGEAAREVKRVRVKPWNKMQALDQLMRHSGLSKDKASEAIVDLAARLRQGLGRVGRGDEDGDQSEGS